MGVSCNEYEETERREMKCIIVYYLPSAVRSTKKAILRYALEIDSFLRKSASITISKNT